MRRAWLLGLVVLACDGAPEGVVEVRRMGQPDAGAQSPATPEPDAGSLTSSTPQRGPVLRAVSPAEGVAGTTVELSIDELLGVPTVTFGALVASDVQVMGVNLVRCRAPAGEGLLDVTVRTSVGQSSLPRAFLLGRGSVSGDGGVTDAGVTDAGSAPSMDAGRTPDAGSPTPMDAGSPGPRQPTFTLQAEAAASMQGVQAVDDMVGFVDDGDWLAFEGVGFGAGVDSVEVRLATPNAGGRLEFRLDGATGPLLGTLAVVSTGSWTDRQPQRVSLVRTTGSRRLVVVARGRPDVANLDAFTFNP